MSITPKSKTPITYKANTVNTFKHANKRYLCNNKLTNASKTKQ